MIRTKIIMNIYNINKTSEKKEKTSSNKIYIDIISENVDNNNLTYEVEKYKRIVFYAYLAFFNNNIRRIWGILCQICIKNFID